MVCLICLLIVVINLLFISDNMIAYAFGSGIYGVFGNGNMNGSSVATPVNVVWNDGIIEISGSHHHLLFLTGMYWFSLFHFVAEKKWVSRLSFF